MDSFEKQLKMALDASDEGRLEETEELCRTLMQTDPKNAQVLFLLGMVLHKTRRDEESVRWLSQAAELQPTTAQILTGLGCAYFSLGDYTRAMESFARSIALDPGQADTYYSMGNACHKAGEIEKAATLFRHAVELNPKDVASWNNLGKSLRETHRIEESIAAFDGALRIQPEYVQARYGRALALLTAGRLEEGFREYEVRRLELAARACTQPAWKGEPIGGKTLFLHAEQGFGDAIQAVRFVPQARQRAARVILECRPELKWLFAYSGCADAVIAYGETIPPFDCYASLISLPALLGATFESIPRQTPYLSAPHGEDLPPAPAGGMRVGLAWAGNPGHHEDAARSLCLEQLTPILETPGAVFYSLQVPVPPGDEAGFRAFPNLVDAGARCRDFMDTATALRQMDLVISVDTAVAHLAGALARPVWTFVPYAADWRWFLDRTDTIWYPTMRLFRQAHPGQWQPVIARVAAELRQRLEPQPAPGG